MRICLVIDDYLPYSIKIGAKMMHELAVQYISHGHEVTVITPDVKLKKRYKIEFIDNVKVVYFKSGEIKNTSKIKRAINETLLSYNAWYNCKEFLVNNPHDLIVYYSPSIFFGTLVNKLKKQWNAKSYLILRDLFPQWAIDNGMIKENSIITKYFKYFENINYKSANKIGLMSNKNREWFKKTYENFSNKSEVLYNWTNNTKYISKKQKYKKQLNIEDKIVFFYGGNMGHAQDMMNLVRLAENMQKYKEAHFVFVGAGDEVVLIENHIKNNNTSNITLLPSVNQDEFLQMLNEFDIGLFTLSKDHKTHNFPGKLLGYMVENLPILGSINPGNDLKDVIDEYNAGLICVNGEDDILFNNAIKLLDKSYRDNISKNAEKLMYDKFSVKKISNQILEGNK
jgi:glycosyltransferase involved in cell wall biosynthesis